MIRARRSSPEPWLEMTPLLDVVFLLLTFFIFSLVLMVRAEVLGVSLPQLAAGETAREGDAIAIVVKADGVITIDGEPTTIDELIAGIRARLEEHPGARLLVAADVDGTSGDLLAVIDKLAGAGLTDFSLVGRPAASADDGADSAAAQPP